MDVIARFPRLPPLGDEPTVMPQPATRPAVQRPPVPRQPILRPAVQRRAGDPLLRRQPGFPTVSVAVLATVAAVAWSLAAWHESARLARQQRPERLAQRPPTAFQPVTP